MNINCKSNILTTIIVKLLVLSSILLQVNTLAAVSEIQITKNPNADLWLSTAFMPSPRLNNDFIVSIIRGVEPSFGQFRLDTRYLYPAVHILDAVYNLDEKTAWDHALYAHEIDLPYVAARVNDSYPGMIQYPLYEHLVIHAYINPESDIHQAISEIQKCERYYLNNNLEIVKSDLEKPIFIGFTGDVLLSRGIDHILTRHKNGLEIVFGELLPYMQNLDYLIGNLEGAVTRTNIKNPKTYNFKFNPDTLAPIKKAGFDYFSLCNNHSWDYGLQGFLDSMDWLKHHSLHTSGVGINRAEAEQPLAITIGNNSVSILSFAAFPKDRKGFNAEKQAVASSSRPGMLWADSETITATAPLLGQPNNDQNHQKSRSSVTVALIHAGIEYAHVPNQKTRQIFQSLASHGWNLVIGSHPHVLQGFEVYKGSLIFYSLGNFIFPGMDEMYRAEESVLVRIGLFDNKILYFEPIGVRLHSRGVNLDKSQQILTRWYKQSKALN